ncbi:Holliday junction branch migration protein RuvA [Patescibacteria group bacterium]|nr:Holliday junction branch migration protein RuvA [Patescibacteria group bacterium]
MIASLSGKIILKREKFIILDVGGVGFKVFLSRKALLKIPQEGESLKVFCYLNVRENILDLYGFLDIEELELFEICEDIRGVGPKMALEIASLGPLEKLKKAIEERDEKIFEGISGIGRKRTQAIILELSGKLKSFPSSPEKESFLKDELKENI